MTPLKAAIFDMVKAAGDIGVTWRQIVAALYRDRRTVCQATVRNHIFQINDMIEDTGWRIVSDRRQWFLHRRK